MSGRNWQKTTDVADGQPVLVSNCAQFSAIVYETNRTAGDDRTQYEWTASVYWQGEANELVSRTFHPTVWLALRWAEEVCEKYSERIVDATVARDGFQARNRGVEVRYEH